MFAGNIWLASALTVTAIFSASAVYKAYSDLQEAKTIQEHYQIITDIKIKLAKQYNKNPQDITRDEIIAHLPENGNWDKVLLLDRMDDSTLNNKEFINENGKIELSEDEKLKVLAIKSKAVSNVDKITLDENSGTYTFEVANNKSIKQKDSKVNDSLEKAIYYSILQVIYGTETSYSTVVTNMVDDFVPLSDIYQDLSDIGESTDSVDTKKKLYFKKLIKERLEKNKNPQESKLYALLKDEL